MPPHRCSYLSCTNTSATRSMFRFPYKEPNRLKLWLENCGNMTLTHLAPENLKNRYLCVDHFEEKSIHLYNILDKGKPRQRNRSKRNAIPKRFDAVDEETASPEEYPDSPLSASPLIHKGFECDNCQGAIIGFRYRCVECDDYDLCHKCEVNQCHSEHFVLRIPKPNTDKKSKYLSYKIKTELKLKNPEQGLSSDNDDEPIQKYKLTKQGGGGVNTNENNIDLDKNIKVMLQLQVNMALKKFKENNKGVFKQYR